MNHQDTKAPSFPAIEPRLDLLAREVVDAAFKVHRSFGPGLLESVYQSCLEIELGLRNVPFAKRLELPVRYEGVSIEPAFRLDLLVDGALVVEIKAVERLLPLHEAQLLTYLRLVPARLGLLINFNVPLIKDGIRRVVL